MARLLNVLAVLCLALFGLVAAHEDHADSCGGVYDVHDAADEEHCCAHMVATMASLALITPVADGETALCPAGQQAEIVSPATSFISLAAGAALLLFFADDGCCVRRRTRCTSIATAPTAGTAP